MYPIPNLEFDLKNGWTTTKNFKTWKNDGSCTCNFTLIQRNIKDYKSGSYSMTQPIFCFVVFTTIQYIDSTTFFLSAIPVRKENIHFSTKRDSIYKTWYLIYWYAWHEDDYIYTYTQWARMCVCVCVCVCVCHYDSNLYSAHKNVRQKPQYIWSIR